MGKSINIVSVTKVTIDNVVSEFTKKVKEYYPKTDKFVNVHFESPFNVGDVIRLDPDKNTYYILFMIKHVVKWSGWSDVDDEEFFDTLPLDGINRMAKPEVS